MVLVGIALAVLTPSVASAQDDGCRRDGNGRIIGTVVGVGADGVLGNVFAGRGDKTEGSIIGAIVGAVVGNQVSKSDRGDCRAAYGYYDARGRWVSTRSDNYQSNDNRPDDQYRPGSGQYDLNQMPTDISTRISWMREYVRSGVQARRIDQANAQYARRELSALEAQNRQFNRDGRFTQREEQTIEKRSDRLTRRLDRNWRQARNY
jgi:hypothetical protein